MSNEMALSRLLSLSLSVVTTESNFLDDAEGKGTDATDGEGTDGEGTDGEGTDRQTG